MTIEADLYSVLAADAGVSALVSTRIYPNLAPESAANPLITYFMLAGTREHTLPGANNMKRKLVQISCHADTYSGAKALAAAVDSALQNNGYLRNEIDLYDPDTQTHTEITDGRARPPATTPAAS